jgi:Na+/H+ antiporter NhaB
MTEPENIRSLILVAIGAGMAGVVFLVALFAIFAEQLGSKFPARGKVIVGVLNLVAAAWWGYVSAVFDGLFVASVVVQGALGFLAIMASRRQTDG